MLVSLCHSFHKETPPEETSIMYGLADIKHQDLASQSPYVFLWDEALGILGQAQLQGTEQSVCGEGSGQEDMDTPCKEWQRSLGVINSEQKS